MIDIDFIFNQAITNIQAKLDDPFKVVINKLLHSNLIHYYN